MPTPRQVLNLLSRDELLALADTHDVIVWDRRSKAHIADRLETKGLVLADRVKAGSYLLYDCACGTGGMLTVAEETLQRIAAEHGQDVKTHLYGQEINPETYAICKADMLMKGEGENADHIIGGAAWRRR